MMVKFLQDRALLLPRKVLVIADLHIGFERELIEAGIHVPSQVPKLQERVDTLLRQTRARNLVILGDLKHQVPGASWQEMREVPDFLERIAKAVRISIIKGNHDSDIERLAPADVQIYGSSGLALGDFALVHGHAWPDRALLRCRTLIMAHIHPAIRLVSGRYYALEHCWLRCPVSTGPLEGKFKMSVALAGAIIMPAFNPLIGGVAVNTDFSPIGPLLRAAAVQLKRAEVWLTDGTAIGHISHRRCDNPNATL